MTENVKVIYVYESTIEELLIEAANVIAKLEAISIYHVAIDCCDGWSATIYYVD
jgi:hypothetical protein